MSADLSSSVRFSVQLREAIRPTTFIRCKRLDLETGASIVIASETFQHTGSFKFRAAFNVAQKAQAKTLIAASSGNYGQALALACQMLGKSCTIVMPESSARVKIEQVRAYGGRVDLIDVKKKSRAERVAELAREDNDALVVSAYDHPDVIEGNSTLGEEIAQYEISEKRAFDIVVAPIGGGGLSSGIIKGLAAKGSQAAVIGAEPLSGNDAARSLRAGTIVANQSEPETLADGARTVSLGENNWEILRTGLSSIVEISEKGIEEAVFKLFTLANLKSEPTGALSLAAVLERPALFARKNICCVVTGGNVDSELYCRLILKATG